MQALVGAVLLVLGVVPRLRLVQVLHRAGRPRLALRSLYLSPIAWIGLILLMGSISATAGAAVVGAYLLVLAGTVAIGLVRGVWRFPTAVRHIGDPEAWRGNRHPYWDTHGKDVGD